MKTIWNAAAGFAAIPLAMTQPKVDLVTPDVEKAQAHIETVDSNGWQKIAHVESTIAIEYFVAEEPKPLTNREEKRLHELAVKAALDTMTAKEREEFDTFQKRRISTQEPLPAQAVEKRERLLRIMDNLIFELNAFKREPRKIRS